MNEEEEVIDDYVDEEQPQNKKGLNKKLLVVIGAIALLLILVVVLGISRCSKPKKDMVQGIEVGKLQEFRYTLKIEIKNGKTCTKIENGRMFMLPEEDKYFRSPITGPRGEIITHKDETLPLNRLKIMRRIAPAVNMANTEFQGANPYIEVTYNIETEGEQKVIPCFEPVKQP